MQRRPFITSAKSTLLTAARWHWERRNIGAFFGISLLGLRIADGILLLIVTFVLSRTNGTLNEIEDNTLAYEPLFQMLLVGVLGIVLFPRLRRQFWRLSQWSELWRGSVHAVVVQVILLGVLVVTGIAEIHGFSFPTQEAWVLWLTVARVIALVACYLAVAWVLRVEWLPKIGRIWTGILFALIHWIAQGASPPAALALALLWWWVCEMSALWIAGFWITWWVWGQGALGWGMFRESNLFPEIHSLWSITLTARRFFERDQDLGPWSSVPILCLLVGAVIFRYSRAQLWKRTPLPLSPNPD